MKNITRTKIYLPMAAMILTAALAIPAAAQTQVPFQGAFQGSDTVAFPTLTQSITGIGLLIGQFSSTTVLTLPAATGSGHWIAANGDSIDTTVVGSPEPVVMSRCQVVGAQPEDTYNVVTQIHTITGGTGRFTGAQGSFILERTHIVAPSADGTHITFGSFHGSITPPGVAN